MKTMCFSRFDAKVHAKRKKLLNLKAIYDLVTD